MKNSSKTTRNVLLLEPNYKNKFPPIGLMKLATYHKMLGDRVLFYKGDMNKFILEQIYLECLDKLRKIDNSVNWLLQRKTIIDFISKGNKIIFENDFFILSENQPLIKDCLNYYRKYHLQGKYKHDPKWDRVCITTLFTFYWDITIKTIEFAKYLVKDLNELKVGGIMASLLSKEIEEETHIRPIQGLLDKPFILDQGVNLIIDDLPLDYSILDEIDYEYSPQNAYYAYTTRGCPNRCGFCAVHKIEPVFKDNLSVITKKINNIKKVYGDQQNLILMDNNIFASPRYKEIITKIKQLGFHKGATYIEPNQLDISIENLRKGLNDSAYVKRSYRLIHKILKKTRGKTAQHLYNTLDKYNLMRIETVTKENLILCYPEIQAIYEQFRPKKPILRYVDFNQGTDCEHISEEKMRLLGEICINPLRIAFDNIESKELYIQAVELAVKYGIRNLSNYLLYNYEDSPEDLYERLKINIELSEKLKVHIYSFPMKYMPISGDDAKNRSYVGPHWNKKFLGAIQAILNVNKGIVVPPNTNNGKGKSFFEKAFGSNLYEFKELLYMPEPYIVYRKICEELGFTKKWLQIFRDIKFTELTDIKEIIEREDFKKSYPTSASGPSLELLRHYYVTRDDIKEKLTK